MTGCIELVYPINEMKNKSEIAEKTDLKLLVLLNTDDKKWVKYSGHYGPPDVFNSNCGNELSGNTDNYCSISSPKTFSQSKARIKKNDQPGARCQIFKDFYLRGLRVEGECLMPGMLVLGVWGACSDFVLCTTCS